VAAIFEPAQRNKNFRRLDFRYGPLAEIGIGEAQQPVQFADGRFRAAFADLLGDIFLRDNADYRFRRCLFGLLLSFQSRRVKPRSHSFFASRAASRASFNVTSG